MANIPPLKTIDDLYIFTRGGTVIDVQKGMKITTTSTTSGGGGYVHPTYGGSISAPSTTTTHDEYEDIHSKTNTKTNTRTFTQRSSPDPNPGFV